ncbi:DUF916 and DUF3324 domain-containing protein [Listeria kieliensis]|uniref:Cell wall anchor protein n=1 Tax=Listeria kieliensis TaxID=1621700 RepID=A0A3D8TUM6_9LIST|nr:DUF916 and DUF3324 domain-containing protein [Listeria kieliensis]RDX01526.1 cell wall anchor protein [Listeria kieliensis]
MKKFGMWLAVLLFAMLILPQNGQASKFNFAVDTVLPDNQIDKQKTYFNLKMKPNQEQTLTIKLRNDTDSPVVINPEIHSATTNRNGVVEYGKSSAKRDSSLSHEMNELIKVKKEITVPAKGSYNLLLEVKMPEKAYDGILAGGITLEEKQTKKSKQDKSEGLQIENKYAYVVGITLQENDSKVKQDLKLKKVAPNQVNARNVIEATLQNPTATYLNRFEVDAVITKKGKDEALYKSKKEGMQVAPNSHFAYPVPLNGEKMKPGKYTLHLKAKSSKESWNFTKDFTIKPEEADKFNAKDVSIKEPNYFWWYVAGIAFLLLAILLGFILWRRKKKREQEQETND